MTDISSLLTPAFIDEMRAQSERDAITNRARREIMFACRHREAGERNLAAMCLDFAADARDDLSRLLAEARGIERDGTQTPGTQAALVALMEE